MTPTPPNPNTPPPAKPDYLYHCEFASTANPDLLTTMARHHFTLTKTLITVWWQLLPALLSRAITRSPKRLAELFR